MQELDFGVLIDLSCMYLYVADKQFVRWILWKCFQDADDNLWTCKRQPLDLWTTTFGLVGHNLWTSCKSLAASVPKELETPSGKVETRCCLHRQTAMGKTQGKYGKCVIENVSATFLSRKNAYLCRHEKTSTSHVCRNRQRCR